MSLFILASCKFDGKITLRMGLAFIHRKLKNWAYSVMSLLGNSCVSILSDLFYGGRGLIAFAMALLSS